jgi:hypothetical protein
MQTNTETDLKFSIFDEKYMGGLYGARGYHFEDSYILCRLPSWLKQGELLGFQQELLTDLELFFNSRHRWFIQIKNHTLGISEFRLILEDFYIREQTSTGEYLKFIIVCPRLVDSIDKIYKMLGRFRDAHIYSDLELENSREIITSSLSELNLEKYANLIFEKLDFDTNVAWMVDQELVQDRFTGHIVRQYDISPQSADELFLRISKLLIAERGKLIYLSILHAAIKQQRVEQQAKLFSQFTLLTPVFLKSYLTNVQGKSLFYDGATPSWSDILFEYDIPREITQKIISLLIAKEHNKTLLPILADAGEGKSTFLRRLAIELVKLGKVVVFHRREAITLHTNEIEYLAQSYNQPIYVLIDDPVKISNFETFIQSLVDNNHSIIVIVTSRSYEWLRFRSTYTAGFNVLLQNSRTEHRLEVLTEFEIKQLILKLIEQNLLAELNSEEIDIAAKIYKERTKGQFLPLVLELTHAERIIQILRNETNRVQSMSNMAFQIYSYACLMGSLGSFITTSMIKELLNIVDFDLLLLDSFPGLLEFDTDRLYVRHDRIGEIVSDNLFEGKDETRGLLICNLLTSAISNKELDVIKAMKRRALKTIPLSQLVRVYGQLIEDLYINGYLQLIYDILEDFVYGMSHTNEIRALLVAKTPLIWNCIIFPNENTVPSINWLFVAKKFNIQIDSPNWGIRVCRLTTRSSGSEVKMKWLAIFCHAARFGIWNQPNTYFLIEVTELLYEVLAKLYPNKKSELFLERANFLREIHEDERAIAYYEMVLEFDSKQLSAHLGLAVCLYFTGRYFDSYKHFCAVSNQNYELVFYHGEEEIFEEFLIKLGLWRELIRHRKLSLKRTFETMKFMHQNNEIKEIRILEKIKKPVNDDVLAESSSEVNLWDYNDANYDKYCDILDDMLQFALNLAPDERIVFGKKMFHKHYFGELYSIIQ